jgi:hypothetical protein
MAQEGQILQLNTQGPNEGIPFVIVDYERKTISYVELHPQNVNDQITVWDVQDYTVTGF